MRILHLLSNHYYTGPAELVLALSRAQARAGHRVSIVVDTFREGDLAERVSSAGVDVDRRLVLSVKAGLRAQLRDVLALRKMWKSDEFDIVHCHKSHEHSLAKVARPRFSKTKLIRTLNKDGPVGIGRRWQVEGTDGILTVSSRKRDELVARRVLGPDRVATVQSVVDLTDFCPGNDGASVRAELGVAASAPAVGIVARIKAGRGHLALLEAWRGVHQVMPAARLLISGRGELYDTVARTASGPEFGGSVIVIGYREDLPRFYRSLDAKVILSPGNDGTCRAAAQAMACGVPVIAPRIGALADMVEDRVTGFVPRSLDPKDLSACIITALSDLDNCAHLGRAASEKAAETFTIEKHHAVVEALYHRALGC